MNMTINLIKSSEIRRAGTEALLRCDFESAMKRKMILPLKAGKNIIRKINDVGF